MQNFSATYTRLDPWPCRDTYAKVFGNRSNVILVVSNSVRNNSGNSLLAYGAQVKNEWVSLVGLPEDPNTRANDGYWLVGGFKVEYCLSSQSTLSENRCSVDYSFPLMIGTFHLFTFPVSKTA